MLKPYTNAGKSGIQSLNSSRTAKGLPAYNAIELSKAQKILNNAYALQKRALNSSLLPTSIIPSATQPGDVLQKTTYMNVLRATLVDWLIPEFLDMGRLDFHSYMDYVSHCDDFEIAYETMIADYPEEEE